ncbi:HD domain-containing protein [Flavobacterium reichenbachii]|uniref:Guanosine-3',5'-bis(Diphosphate) 3'-pyrophosphohydrolase n=1 Tax=Flavobacterium reichenbachii TaxID=362418 RepID=A0A085ZN36_9FLAO|nr:HD domain-containing protein [Flavobacterium reichenbachii]KFF05850.1 guanosine-3',5'-bis(diphosphate) 3'-pyrophosphohydrolase [Flavobacterium reichenbachii]OXB12735.1 guanosine-3',5'-bis(diphosphate) 3'-pyrophosphohydrolase [Flavobacterium reichenbachii]
MNNWSIDDLQKTWHLVSKLHEGQKYGGEEEGLQIEYINHIGSVTFEIINALNHSPALNGDLAVKCALLHDTIEDTEISFEKVKVLFGQEVANGVSALTKDTTLKDKSAQMEHSLSRITQQPKEVWSVKMADRICNLYAPPYYWTNEKIIEYHKESLLIYDTLKEGNIYLANRLKEKIENYKLFFK